MQTAYGTINKVLLAGFLGLSVISCSGEDGDSEKLEARSRYLEGESLTPETRQIFIITSALEVACMKKKGFKYFPARPPSAGLPNSQGDGRGDDVASRRTNGYGTPVSREIAEAEQSVKESNGANARYLQTLSKAEQTRWEQALSGNSTTKVGVEMPNNGGRAEFNANGCTADVKRALYGDLQKYTSVHMVAVNVRGEVARIVLAAPEVLEADRKWKECMTRRGYHYENPGDAREAAEKVKSETSDRSKARQKEITIATADAECDRQAGLTKTKLEVRKRAEKTVAKKREAEILADLEYQKEALKRAKKLLDPKVLNQ